MLVSFELGDIFGFFGSSTKIIFNSCYKLGSKLLAKNFVFFLSISTFRQVIFIVLWLLPKKSKILHFNPHTEELKLQ